MQTAEPIKWLVERMLVQQEHIAELQITVHRILLRQAGDGPDAIRLSGAIERLEALSEQWQSAQAVVRQEFGLPPYDQKKTPPGV